MREHLLIFTEVRRLIDLCAILVVSGCYPMMLNPVMDAHNKSSCDHGWTEYWTGAGPPARNAYERLTVMCDERAGKEDCAAACILAVGALQHTEAEANRIVFSCAPYAHDRYRSHVKYRNVHDHIAAERAVLLRWPT